MRGALLRVAQAAGLAATAMAATAAGGPAPSAFVPGRATTLIVPFTAGGTTDTLMRALAQLAAPLLGHAVVVENKPGGSMLIAAEALRRARPDGHTLGVVPMSINRLRALGRTQIDLARDFSFIARVAGQTHGLVVRADSPLNSVADLVRAARERPGALTYGTSGVASITHVAMEDFAQRAGIRLRHIPFKGGTESLQALRGGVVDLLAESPLWLPQVEQGDCRLLATWNEQRLPRFAAVPTMIELGYPLVAEATVGLGGPAGIEAEVLARLRQVFAAAIRSAAFRAECDRLLATVRYLDGDAMRAHARDNESEERERMRRLKLELE